MWSDERIDDRSSQFDRNMAEFRAEMHEFRAEMRDMRIEMQVGFTSLRREMLYAVLAMSSVLVATMATILAKTL